jgi:hypothetical protein
MLSHYRPPVKLIPPPEPALPAGQCIEIYYGHFHLQITYCFLKINNFISQGYPAVSSLLHAPPSGGSRENIELIEN